MSNENINNISGKENIDISNAKIDDVVQKIIDIFETYQTLSNDRNEYFNKKYYMAGFDDGEKWYLEM